MTEKFLGFVVNLWYFYNYILNQFIDSIMLYLKEVRKKKSSSFFPPGSHKENEFFQSGKILHFGGYARLWV